MRVAIGAILLVIGMSLAVVWREPHFYTFFSVGAFILLEAWYHKLYRERLFAKWGIQRKLVYFVLVLLASIVVDKLGLALGYWTYPSYLGWGDEVLKFIFEWVVALTYVMLAFLVGLAFFKQRGASKLSQWLGALLIFVIPVGLVTEYFNHFANSWVVTGVPFTNLAFGGYFLIFQTLGYSTMTLIPWVIYQLAKK